MKALQFKELAAVTDWIKENLLEAELRSFTQASNYLIFIFFSKGKYYQIYYEIKSAYFMAFPSFENKKIKSPVTPMTLFFKAHFTGAILSEVQLLENFGRVVNLKFKNEEKSSLEIQFRLFPKGKNVIFLTPEKKMALAPILELEPQINQLSDLGNANWQQLFTAFKGQGGPHLIKKKASPLDVKESLTPEEILKKAITKKEQIVSKIKLDLGNKKNDIWQELAQILTEKINTPIEKILFSEKLKKKIDLKLTTVENKERAFYKIKQNKQKKEASLRRIDEIEKEILQLKKGDADFLLKKSNLDKNNLLQKSGISKGRIKYLNQLRATMGRSGKENIQILKKAKPCYYWFNLKDRPGSHCVLEVDKNYKEKLPLNEIGRWLVSESFKQKADFQKGLKFDMIYSQCRYVSPIKGDKLGRVKLNQFQSYCFIYD